MDYIQVFLSALLAVVVLFFLTKLMGNKQISQLTMFDYIIGITIGSIAAEMSTELDKNIFYGIIAMSVWAFLDYFIAIISRHFLSARKAISGSPLILMNNGKIYRENFKKARIDLSDFLTLCRVAGYFDISQIQTAVFEYNGTLSFLPLSDMRSVNPKDLKLNPLKESFHVNIVLDSRIISKNLKQIGKDKKWLLSELKKQGYNDEKNVFLASCDEDNNLIVYPINNSKTSNPFS